MTIDLIEDGMFISQLVYDKDTFSTDDFMGEAEIDIQPLVTAARAFERSKVDESTELGCGWPAVTTTWSKTAPCA